MEPRALVVAIAELLGAWLLFGALVWAVYAGVRWARAQLQSRYRSLAEAPRLAAWHRLIGRQLFALAILVVRATAALVVLLIFSSLLTFSFSLFPATSGISTTLIGFLSEAGLTVLRDFAGYLPNLAVVVFVGVAAWFLIRLVRAVASGVEEGLLVLPGFHAEWAKPTHDLLSVLIVVFALVVAFPYLPGGDSPAFRGISIFIGVLLSLGSGSAVGNLVAGVILTYMRPYRVGDRVRIADTIGDIVSRNLLVTRIRTIKNVETIIPNSAILGAHILNYSAEAQTRGLILHTTVTIGYDAPWRKVHELLIEAALNTECILREPAPFVFQTSLNDFHVSYEINAFTAQPNRMQEIYSLLHQNIQESFNRGGIEIMSPAYHALRDGNMVTIPEEQRPAEYRAKAFRVDSSPPQG